VSESRWMMIDSNRETNEFFGVFTIVFHPKATNYHNKFATDLYAELFNLKKNSCPLVNDSILLETTPIFFL